MSYLQIRLLIFFKLKSLGVLHLIFSEAFTYINIIYEGTNDQALYNSHHTLHVRPSSDTGMLFLGLYSYLLGDNFSLQRFLYQST